MCIRDRYYPVSDGLVLIRNSAQANVDSWTTGDLRFDNTTLKEMAKVIERRYDVKIRIMDSSLVEEYFTCHFRKDLTIAQAMELLSLIHICGRNSCFYQLAQIFVTPGQCIAQFL